MLRILTVKHASRATPSIAEITNEWSCTSSPTICLHGEGKDDFTLSPYLRYTGCEQNTQISS